MAIIPRKTKTKGTTYQVKIRDATGKFVSNTYYSEREAKKQEALLIAKKHQGKLVCNSARKITLSEFWEKWFNEVNNSISTGWRITQEQMFRDYINPQIGSIQICKIMPFHIGRVLTSMEAKGRSSQTIKHVYGLLNKLFKSAKDDYRVINSSPVKRHHQPKVVFKPTVYLEIEELKRLLLFTKKSIFGPVIWIQSFAGLRVGEVQSLKWGNINFEKNIINITSSYSKKSKKINFHTKSLNQHYVPMTPELNEYLKSVQGLPDEWVCKNQDGSFFSQSTYGKKLKLFCNECEIKAVSSHGLRHSLSGIVTSFGGNEDDLQILLNHKSRATTRRYSHGQDAKMRQVSTLLNRVKILEEDVPKCSQSLRLIKN
jgi:integrase